MKLRRLFCCLLACVFICSVAFSHSAYAIEVNGYDVTTAYSLDGEEYQAFTTTVVTNYWYTTLYVDSTIVFPTALKSGTVFNMIIEVDHSPCSSITAVCNLYDSTDYLLGTENLIVQDGVLSLREVLVANGDLSYMKIHFTVNDPTLQENTIYETYHFTINGTEYSCLEGCTWADFEILNADGTIYSDDGCVMNSTISNGPIYYNGQEVYEDYYIVNGGNYWLNADGTVFDPLKTFKIYYYQSDGRQTWAMSFQYEDGMTWSEWVNSEYNTSNGLVIYNSSNGGPSIKASSSSSGSALLAKSAGVWCKGSDVISQPIYGNNNYWSYMANVASTFSTTEYVFNLTVVNIDVVEYDEEQLQGGILGWIKNIFNSLKEIPNKIASSIKGFFDNVVKAVKDLPSMIADSIKGFFDNVVNAVKDLGQFIIDGIKSLFIPDEAELTAYKDKWMALLEDRFGVLFESMSIIDSWADAFTSTSAKETITFPSVTVPLAGADFTFGGWEVDIVPDKFEGVLDACKLIINIICTLAFVNALRKRLEEVLG